MATDSTWPKSPLAVLDYSVDWSDWLATSETISTSTWSVPAGLTQDSETETTTRATVFLSGGTVGTVYTVTNTITTNQGRTDARSLYITVRNR